MVWVTELRVRSRIEWECLGQGGMTDMPKYVKKVRFARVESKRAEIKRQRSEDKLVNELNHQLMIGFTSDLPLIWHFKV